MSDNENAVIIDGTNDKDKHAVGAKKRSHIQREKDLTIVADMYLRGFPQAAIARHISEKREYSLSRSQISYDLMSIYDRWRESYMVDIDTHKSRELAKINRLENEYWDAWFASKHNQKVVEHGKNVDAGHNKDGEVTQSYTRNKERVTTTERDGDKDFLKGIQWCIDKRCKILGLDAAKTVQVNWRKEAQAAGVDPDNMVDELANQFMLAATTPSNKDNN